MQEDEGFRGLGFRVVQVRGLGFRVQNLWVLAEDLRLSYTKRDL